jgi:hypothetical protein
MLLDQHIKQIMERLYLLVVKQVVLEELIVNNIY